jgi:methyl-accepting chemotaxis protein
MKLKDLKIGTLLILGFAIMFLFVILLGVVSYRQSDRLQQQTEKIYNHPLKTRRALSNLKVDVLNIRVGLRDLILTKDDSEKQNAIKLMEISSANVNLQFDILYDSYLGPREDIDEAVEAFTSWNVDREECVKLVSAGEIEKVEKAIVSTGKISELRNILLAKIKKMDDFSVRKSDMIFENSVHLRNSLNQQLIYIVVTILLLMLVISYLLVKNIRKPIKELASAVNIFQNGDTSVRSRHDSKNEFGVLSKAFNSMLESIQVNIDLSQKATELSQIMLIEEDPHKFFASVLPTLAEQTNSQMAAIYLLSDDKKRFEHFESFGM